MKLEMITAAKNTLAKMISSSAKTEKAASVAIKDGEKMMASTQDALAAQGKASILPYPKPMGEVNLNKTNSKAASGFGDISDDVIGGGSAGAPYYSSSEWDEAMELVNEVGGY